MSDLTALQQAIKHLEDHPPANTASPGAWQDYVAAHECLQQRLDALLEQIEHPANVEAPHA